jgi:hypothetical protein
MVILRNNKISFPNKEIPPLVLVGWEDAKVISDGSSSWMENKDYEYLPHIVWQVGFLLKDVDEGIQIVEAWNKDLIGLPTQIPRGMIRYMKKLSPIS